MQIGQSNNHILVQLDVTFLHHPFATHHLDQFLIPLSDFLLHLLGLVVMGDHRAVDRIHIELIRPDQVLNLPHIKQIFSDILFSFLSSYYHIGKDKLYSDNA